MLWRALVALVEFEFLDDVGVPEDPQQDFLRDQERAEQADLWGEETGRKTHAQVPRWKVKLHRERRRSRGSLTCSQETVGRQHELRRDLHLAVGVVLEGGEVRLVFVGVHLLPVPVVSCRGQKEA